jgi:hypothetical protein
MVGMKRLVVMSIAAALLVGACGGGSSKTADPASTSSTSTTIKTATTEQIASIVAKQDADIRSAVARAESCQFLDDRRCDLIGLLAIQELGSLAKSLQLTLDNADDVRPNNGLFVGAIPAELKSLVASTLDTDGALVAAVDDFIAKDCLPKAGVKNTSAPCGGAALLIHFHASSLINDLDGWRPYL